MFDHIHSNRAKQISDRSLFPYTILFSLYLSMVVMGALLATKLVQFGSVIFDAGLPVYAISFFITDIVSEIYGKQYSRKMIWSAFLALIVSFLCIKLVLVLPGAEAWQIAGEFNTVFGMSNQIYIAALVVFLLSQYVDITVFAWVRKKTNGKHLWLRNNISTLAGGAVDAFLFALIAFYGVYSMDVIWGIATTAYVVKILIAAFDTPFAYFGVWIMHRLYPELKS